MVNIGPPKTLDVRLFYSREEAYQWLTSLTEIQRSDYLITEYFDIVYTLSYSIIFFLVLGPLGLIPGILDLIETIPIIFHLRTGSDLPAQIGFISGFKWITGAFAFGVIFWKFVMWIKTRSKAV